MQIVTQLYLVFDHLRRESTVVHESSTKDESVNKSDWVSTVFFSVSIKLTLFAMSTGNDTC